MEKERLVLSVEEVLNLPPEIRERNSILIWATVDIKGSADLRVRKEVWEGVSLPTWTGEELLEIVKDVSKTKVKVECERDNWRIHSSKGVSYGKTLLEASYKILRPN